MDDDDFGDLYTDIEPQTENRFSQGPSLQFTGHNIYGGYDENEDEDEVDMYGSFRELEHSAPRESISALYHRVSGQQPLEVLEKEKDSEEALLYGLLDDGGFHDASKELQPANNQQSNKQNSSDHAAVETREMVKEVKEEEEEEEEQQQQQQQQKQVSHDFVVTEEALEHFQEMVNVESQDDIKNSFMEKDDRELKSFGLSEEEDTDFGAETAPPGLSMAANIADFSAVDDVDGDWAQKEGQAFGAEGDDDNGLDSDSEDDLQILLNDDNTMYAGAEMAVDRVVEGSEDEDEEDLVIVAADELPDDREWGDDQTQALEASVPASSGGAFVPGLGAGAVNEERGQGVKASIGAGATMGASRLGYSGKPYHQPHHSQFKYVRPGLAAAGGSSAATTSNTQATMQGTKILSGAGSWASGRGVGGPSMVGRGDWGGAGRSAPGSQRPGLGGGMLYVHNGRNLQYGMEFSLPPGKSVFDIDLDTFEDKPWRHPAADITDYFNFNFNETTWKQYCSQLVFLFGASSKLNL